MCARFDDGASFEGGVFVDSSFDSRFERLEDEPVALEQRILLAGVDPPAVEDLVADPVAAIDQPLDRVGDLELAAGRRLYCRDGFMDHWVEEVDADEREIGRRFKGLFDQSSHLPGRIQVGDPKLARVIDAGEQDLCRRRFGSTTRASSLEAFDELVQPVLEHVVAEVHHEVAIAQEIARDQHAVSEPERSPLRDVRDVNAPARSVANRALDLGSGIADDNADFLDPGLGHGLNAIEEDRLVGDGYQLFGTGVRDRAEPRSRSAGKDEALHCAGPGLDRHCPIRTRDRTAGEPACFREVPAFGLLKRWALSSGGAEVALGTMSARVRAVAEMKRPGG